MKTRYWCVMSEFYDNGKVKAHMVSRECEEKPLNSNRGFPFMDAYNDWFEVLEKAESFLAEVRTMDKQGAAA